jgi:hypothetical protein
LKVLIEAYEHPRCQWADPLVCSQTPNQHQANNSGDNHQVTWVDHGFIKREIVNACKVIHSILEVANDDCMTYEPKLREIPHFLWKKG